MKEAFGLLAVVLGIGAAGPYIRNILKHAAKPHRVTWAIWASLGLINLSSQLAKGAHWSALLAVAAAFNNIVIFILSLRFGVGGASVRDKIALLLGLLGVVLWALTKEATFALVFAITADAIGTALTLEKAFKQPRSESALAWTMSAVASICGLLAVHIYNFAQTIYPAYAVVGGSSLALLTILRRTNLTASNPKSAG